jgi:hypothetical protein
MAITKKQKNKNSVLQTIEFFNIAKPSEGRGRLTREGGSAFSGDNKPLGFT